MDGNCCCCILADAAAGVGCYKSCRGSGTSCMVSSSTVRPSASMNQSIAGGCGGASCIMATLNTAMKTGSTIATSLIQSCVQKKAIAAKVATAPASNMTMIIIAIIAIVALVMFMRGRG